MNKSSDELHRLDSKGPLGTFLKDLKRYFLVIARSIRVDLQLVTENNTWDIDVLNGLPLTLNGDNENTQRAMIASFLQPNTIPNLESVGNPWTDYISGSISLTEMDSAVRKNINLYMESLFFVPFYNVKDNKLTYNISKVAMTGAK